MNIFDMASESLQKAIKAVVDNIKGTVDSTKNEVVSIKTIQTEIKTAVNETQKIVSTVSGCTVFNKPGTYAWTCPANVKVIRLTMFGGGASGNAIWESSIDSGSDWAYGGDGGSYVAGKFLEVVPGSTYTLIVGAGGESVAPPTQVGSRSPEPGKAGGVTSGFGIICNGGSGSNTGRQNHATTNSPLGTRGSSGVRGEGGSSASLDYKNDKAYSTKYGLPGLMKSVPRNSSYYTYAFGGGAGYGDGGDAFSNQAPTVTGYGAGGGASISSGTIPYVSGKGGDGIIIIEW